MKFKITRAKDAVILRSFLKETLGISARTVTALKGRANGILLNGQSVTVRAQLKVGDTLSLALEDTESNENLLPRPLPLSVLYEDKHLTLVNKSGDMPTHPSQGHFEDTLANALAYRYRDVPYVFRAITRLDRETSGVVLTARTAADAHALSLSLQSGAFEKSYFALVRGSAPISGEIDAPIRRKPNAVLLREIHPSGAPAITRYIRLATRDGYSLLSVFPQTGRTHQIRLHLASIGHPICGDFLYGAEDKTFPRTLLHAARLAFPHPATGERMSFFAPLPTDFCAALTCLALPLPNEADALPQESAFSALRQNAGQKG